MSERKDRLALLPSLLDRLTDDEPVLVAESARLLETLETRLDPASFEALRLVLADEHRGPLSLDDAASCGLKGLDGAALERVNELVRLEQRRRFERRADRLHSVDRLQAAVVQHLEWLLNTESLGTLGIDDGDEVANSVLNYGVAPLLGRTLGDLRSADGRIMAAEIQRAVRHFEPRLAADTVIVRLVDESPSDPRAIRLQIEGDLLVNPAPVHLVLDTVFDAEEATFRIGATP